ncbi:hypothetical protein [Curtobacterium sp. VKM Ac-2922]|uniref:hypothetical protein n=1 Tax=Curtobacterium sp. VKM Ac-2922 TaxID=2929475 RepID=UPI001FB4E09A|nr:hypothetical protein [Curtobacterium sp. VKM Ac-2922]MCJ1714390.1 hypothetical protein [Curtobacterium sp. VKM Ac-2922]
MFMLVTSGLPIAVGIGLTVGGVLAHADARRDAVTDAHAGAPDRSTPRRGRVAAAITAAGWLVAALLSLLSIGTFQWWPTVLPIAAGIVACVAAAHLPVTRPSDTRPVLDLRHRGALTFTSRSEVLVAAVASAVLAVTVIAAGAMSSDDGEGRWAFITIPVGDDGTASTEFFGWYYGVPVLTAALVLAVVALTGLQRIARVPRFHDDRVADDLIRRGLSTAVLRSATAALLITIGTAWELVARASQLRTSIPRTHIGTIEFGTSFAAAGPVLDVAAHCSVGLGLALLVAQLLRGRRRRTSAAVAHDPRRARV